ncbi:MAG TPA: gluconokinase [Chloroflexota bacterium]|nr:gluconokinase [Chloroflexota bacterium]
MSNPPDAHITGDTPSVTVTRKGAADPLILTIDVGTSSVRAALYDGQARAIQGLAVQEVHEMRSTPDGGVEVDADQVFQRVCTCIDRALQQAGDLAGRIVAVAPTTFWHNVLGVAADGAAITPIYTWADTRSRAAADELRAVLDADAMHARTGCFLHPSYLPAKIRWLQGGAADLRNLRYWLSFAELMMLRFFAQPRCSISMASASGLLDQYSCTWDRETLAAIPLDARQLSPLDDTPQRGLLPRFATRWPSLANAPWYPGWGDGATSNTGCGSVTRRQAALMVGTSGALRSAWRADHFTIPPKLWCYRIDRTRIVMGGALSNGGNLLEWLRDTLRLPCAQDGTADLRSIEQQIAGLEPDGHGLTILPFLAGERSPDWATNATGTISGLRLHTRPIDLMRAGYEAVAYRFGLIYELLCAAIPDLRAGAAQPVIASGGALLHSPTWMQMMADVLDAPVVASAVPEASSRGAALLALEALGAIAGIEAMTPPLEQTYMPNPAATARYRVAALRQRDLYDLLVRSSSAR